MENKPYQGWTIIADCDGTLTDGKKYVNAKGERESIAFHSRDSVACQLLVEMGFTVIVLTQSHFNGIAHYWQRHGANVFMPFGHSPLLTGKLEVAETLIDDWSKTIGIGDDITDICFLEKCEYSYYPSDAHPHFKASIKHTRLCTPGGGGALASIYQLVQSGTYEQ